MRCCSLVHMSLTVVTLTTRAPFSADSAVGKALALGAICHLRQQSIPYEAICHVRAVPLSQPLRIITDSKYVYDGVTLYMHRWALQGRRVTNQDLWESLKAVLQTRSAETL